MILIKTFSILAFLLLINWNYSLLDINKQNLNLQIMISNMFETY